MSDSNWANRMDLAADPIKREQAEAKATEDAVEMTEIEPAKEADKDKEDSEVSVDVETPPKEPQELRKGNVPGTGAMKIPFIVGGVSVAVIGLAMLIVGMLVPGIVEQRVKDAITDNLPRSEKWVTEDLPKPSKQAYNLRVFNVTNAAQVLEGEKPIVTEHFIEAVRTQTNYAAYFDENKDEYGYRNWWELEPTVAGGFDMEFITLNPVYVGAVYNFGTETILQGFITPNVLSKLVTDAVPMLPNLFISGHIQAMLGICISAPAATPIGCFTAFNGGNMSDASPAVDAVINQVNILAELDVSRTGWELPAAVEVDLLTKVLLNNTNPFSLLTTDGMLQWLNLAGVFAAGNSTEITNTLTGYNAALAASGVTLSLSNAGTIAGYLGTYITSPAMQARVLATACSPAPLVGFPDSPRSWTDIFHLQLGQGAVFGEASAGRYLSQPAFEFYAYQFATRGANSTTAVKQNLTQSKAMFEKLGNASLPQYSGVFCLLAGPIFYPKLSFETINALFKLQTDQSGDMKVMGVTEDNVNIFYDYICEYLPTKFVLEGQLQMHKDVRNADGTGPLNAGMFIKRSLREILSGYNDPLGSLLGAGYGGLFNANTVNSSAAALARDVEQNRTDVYTIYTAGLKDPAKADSYVAINGVEFFNTSTDLGGSCPSPFTVQLLSAKVPRGRSYRLAESCKVWEEREVIKGVPNTRFPPVLDELPQEYLTYVSVLNRGMIWTKDNEGYNDADVELHGVKLERYVLKDSEFLTPSSLNATGASTATIARAERYAMVVDGCVDLSRVAGAPAYGCIPRHSKSADERGKIMGKTPADWEDYDKALHATYIDVEPQTGAIMNVRQRFQYSFRLDRAQYNGFYKDMDVGGSSSHIIFPIMWIEDKNSITKEQGNDFVELIYGAVETGRAISIALILVGFVLIFVGMFITEYGTRRALIGDSKAELPQHSP